MFFTWPGNPAGGKNLAAGGRNLVAGNQAVGRHRPGDNLGQVEGMHHPGGNLEQVEGMHHPEGNQLADNLDLEVDSHHMADRRLVVVRIRQVAG
jgi:hypothetical protein